jgi:hypothetical protein
MHNTYTCPHNNNNNNNNNNSCWENLFDKTKKKSIITNRRCLLPTKNYIFHNFERRVLAPVLPVQLSTVSESVAALWC